MGEKRGATPLYLQGHYQIRSPDVIGERAAGGKRLKVIYRCLRQ